MAKKATAKKKSGKRARPRAALDAAAALNVIINTFSIDDSTRSASAIITPETNEFVTMVELHKKVSGTYQYLQDMLYVGSGPVQETWRLSGDDFFDPNEPEDGKSYRCKVFSEIMESREQDSEPDTA